MHKSSLVSHILQKQSYLCVGLDTDATKLPAPFKNDPQGVVKFNRAIVEATLDHCVAYKINTAFYEAQGRAGWDAMEQTLSFIPNTHFTIADAKRGDIGNTSAQYAKTFFEVLPFDAITVAPYMGEDSVRPFLEYENKWTIVLGLTSNKGSDDFQQLALANTGEFLFERVMKKVASWGHAGNLMFVVGATKAEALALDAKEPPCKYRLPVASCGGGVRAMGGGRGAMGGALDRASSTRISTRAVPARSMSSFAAAV
jgi:orotidine-5'-phosphate decarboxylase